MKRVSPAVTAGMVVVFFAGFFFHVLYQRWNPTFIEPHESAAHAPTDTSTGPTREPRSFRVNFAPSSTPDPSQVVLPLLSSRDVEKIRALAGNQARVRGRIFRVGHSAKSNTYFLNFGPSRDALTGVIFASAAELFEQKKLPPKSFEGREVEVQGEIKNHPQYGLEVILESPTQIKLLD